MQIRVPVNLAVRIENRKPREAMTGAYLVVDKSVLAIAPRAENHSPLWIAIDHAMSPTRRNDKLIARSRRNRNALSRFIRGELLRIDNRAAFPNFEHFRRGPSAMRRDGMDVSLAANRLITEATAGIDNDAKQKHSPHQLGAMLFASHIHHDRVNRVGSFAFWIAQTSANVIEPSKLGLGSKH